MVEERASWSTVRLALPKKSFADAVRSPPLSGANHEPIGKPKISHALRNRLIFSESSSASGAKAAVDRPPVRVFGNRSDRQQRPATSASSNSCVRCLMSGHSRAACRRPIRCRACHGWGHIAMMCSAPARFPARQISVAPPMQSSADRAKAPAKEGHGLFLHLNSNLPSSSEPPVFPSFGTLFGSGLRSGNRSGPVVVVPWHPPPSKQASRSHPWMSNPH
jgi:hypothetical protein